MLIVSMLVVGALGVSAVPTGYSLTTYTVQGGNRQTIQVTPDHDSVQGNEGELAPVLDVGYASPENTDFLQPTVNPEQKLSL